MRLNGASIYLFIAGVSALFRLQVGQGGGDLILTELLLIASLFARYRELHRVFSSRIINQIVIAAAFWFLNLVATDIYRNSPLEDWARGWAKIVFFLLDFLALVILTELKMEKVAAFLTGLAASSVLIPFLQPDQYSTDFIIAWKFHYSFGLTVISALMFFVPTWRRTFGYLGEWLPLALVGLSNLMFNARSMFGIAIAAVLFGALKKWLDSSPFLRAKISPLTFGIILIAGLIVSQGLISVYSVAADSGWLGADAKDKYMAQSEGDLSLLQAGRNETLVSLQAIADAPIIGHGSWAKDMYYVLMLVDILESHGIKIQGDPFEYPLIPTHSFIFGAWVEAGLFGGLFWAFILILLFKAIYTLLKTPGLPATFASLVLFLAIWDIMFSPFGAGERYKIASKICIALSILSNYPTRVRPNILRE